MTSIVGKKKERVAPQKDVNANLMKAILLDYTSVELSELDEQMEAHPFQTSEAFERKMKRALCWRTGRLRKSLVVIRNVLAYAAAFF